MNRIFVLTTLLCLSLATAASTAADKPNIIFILCDDLGYGDVKCLNPEGKIATPNMDRTRRRGHDLHRRPQRAPACALPLAMAW
jgi:arylsulfatase A